MEAKMEAKMGAELLAMKEKQDKDSTKEKFSNFALSILGFGTISGLLVAAF